MLAWQSLNAMPLIVDKVPKDYAVECDVGISCFNAADSVIVSGKGLLLDALVMLARDQGVLAQGIRTFAPGHCKYI